MVEYDNLIGLKFEGIGTRDCFSLVQDFYSLNFGITLTNYPRPQDWSSDSLDLIEMCYENENFEKLTDWTVKDLRPGDLLAMAIGERNPNHLAIFLGDNQILHHKAWTFSNVEPFRDFWRHVTCYILRHREVPDLRPVLPDLNLMEYINDRNNPSTSNR